MSRYLSVFALAVRGSLYKVLWILAAAAALETRLFLVSLRRGADSLEQAVEQSGAAYGMALAFLAVTVFLWRTGCEYGSRQGYTLRRLMVSETAVFAGQAVYNVLCYLAVWALQAGLTLLFCRLYVLNADPASVSGQTVFLAYYRSSFLHSLLPLEEYSVWIRNVCLVLGLGIGGAYFPFRQRRGELGLAPVFLAAAVLLFFCRDLGDMGADVFFALVSMVLAGYEISQIWGIRREERNDG